MKKKIALLLAAIMTLSTVPANVFAASDNRLSRDTLSIPSETLIYEETIPDNQKANSYQGLSGTVTGADDTVSNYVQGMDLILDLKDNATSGSSFRIELENADWYFDNRENGLTGGTTFAYNKNPGAQRITPVGGAAYTYLYNDTAVTQADVNYTIAISPYNKSSAVVTLLADEGGDGVTIVKKPIRVPLLLFVEDEDVDVTAQVTDNSSPVTRGTYLIATSAGGSTITTASSIETGREAIDLDTIAIKETKNDSLNAKGAFELMAPAGYYFKDNFSTATDTVKIVSEPGLGTMLDWGYYWTDDEDHTSIAIFANMASTSVDKISGAITLTGITLEPLDEDDIYFDETLKMDIYNYVGEADIWTPGGTKNGSYAPTTATGFLDEEIGLEEESFDVAKAVDWGVTLTLDGDVTQLISGRSATDPTHEEHETAKVVFEEAEIGSWLADRTTTFRLPEGVEIIGVKFDEIENINAMLPSGVTTIKRDMTVAGEDVTKLTEGDITISDNEMTLKNVETVDGKKAKLEFTLFVSIDPNFEGDITLETVGSGMPDEIDSVVIAEAIPPIVVTSTSKDVQIGYQRYAVSDITISETQPGAIKKDGELIIRIDDYSSNNDIYFAQLTDENFEIVEGDIGLSLENAKDGTITFEVERASRKASVIKLTDLEVRIDRTVPWGSYDLIVYGDPVYQNYTNDADNDLVRKLGTFGDYEDGFVMENYINVVTEGSNVSLTNNVQVTKDSATLVVNGEAMLMTTNAIIDPESQSLLVPFRSVLNALGISDKDIYFDDTTKTVTIISTSNNRTVRITANSDTMEINGAKQTMITNGYPVKAKIVNEWMMVPFRYVGIGLGISDMDIAYNPATETAEYNPVSNE